MKFLWILSGDFIFKSRSSLKLAEYASSFVLSYFIQNSNKWSLLVIFTILNTLSYMLPSHPSPLFITGSDQDNLTMHSRPRQKKPPSVSNGSPICTSKGTKSLPASPTLDSCQTRPCVSEHKYVLILGLYTYFDKLLTLALLGKSWHIDGIPSRWRFWEG